MESQSSPLKPNIFQPLKTLIEARTGLEFNGHRQESLHKGLVLAATQAGADDLETYYLELQKSNTDSPLWDDLIAELTIGETYFFRNPSHMDALRFHILPGLIKRHQINRRLRIWSAGCATGEEPYSLAILLYQLIQDIADWNILILATDINRRAIQSAALAKYRQWSFRETPAEIQKRYFKRQDETYELVDPIRNMVSFGYLNLVDDRYPSLTTNTNAMDLIICRNVAIYLPERVNRSMAGRFYNCLASNGWLMMGASETNVELFGQFKSENLDGATVYKKSTGTGPLSFPVNMKPGDSQVTSGMPAQKSSALPPASQTPRHHASPSAQASTFLASSSHPQPTKTEKPGQSVPSPDPAKINPGSECYQNGLSLMKQKRIEEAQQSFLNCLKADPDYAAAYYQIARIQANNGYLTKAQDWLKQALERDPLMIEALYTLALILQEKGDTAQAITQHKKVLYLEPDFVLAHYGLSILYRDACREQLAQRHLSQAIRLASRFSGNEELPASDGLTAQRLLKMMLATTSRS